MISIPGSSQLGMKNVPVSVSFPRELSRMTLVITAVRKVAQFLVFLSPLVTGLNQTTVSCRTEEELSIRRYQKGRGMRRLTEKGGNYEKPNITSF